MRTLASTVVRYRDDLGGGARDVREPGRGPSRPAGAAAAARGHRFAADVSVRSRKSSGIELSTTVTLLTGRGQLIRVPIGTVRTNEPPQRFDVALPADAELSVVRFDVGVGSNEAELDLRWSLTQRAGGRPDRQLVRSGPGRRRTGSSPTPEARTLDQRHDRLEDPRGIAADRTHRQPGPRRSTRRRLCRDPCSPARGRACGGHSRRPACAADRSRRHLRLTIAGADVSLRVVAEVAAVPGTSRAPAAMIADLPSLAVALGRARPVGCPSPRTGSPRPQAVTATVAEQTRLLPGIRTLDRATLAATAGREPYGVGGRSALFAAGLGALLLALIGIAVDVRAATRRRVGEFAVLQTMGAGSRLLARAVLAEQAFLAGLGVLVGLAVGVGVAATMAPLVILTPTADRPEPVPLLSAAMVARAGHGGRALRRGDASQRRCGRHPGPPARGGAAADRRRPVIATVLRRLRTFAGSLGLLALLALAASLLLTATPHLANRYTDQGLREWISSLPYGARDISYLTESDVSADPSRPTLRPSQASNYLGELHSELPPVLQERLSGEWYSAQIDPGCRDRG